MNFRIKSQHGQAFVELALIIFLFALFVIGITQLVMLGSAQIRVQEAARRMTWLRNRLHKAPIQDSQVRNYLPQCTITEISGDLKDGIEYEVKYTVPAIGFFRWFKPEGFEVRAHGAVMGEIKKPKIPEEIINSIWEKISEWKN